MKPESNQSQSPLSELDPFALLRTIPWSEELSTPEPASKNGQDEANPVDVSGEKSPPEKTSFESFPKPMTLPAHWDLSEF